MTPDIHYIKVQKARLITKIKALILSDCVEYDKTLSLYNHLWYIKNALSHNKKSCKTAHLEHQNNIFQINLYLQVFLT